MANMNQCNVGAFFYVKNKCKTQIVLYFIFLFKAKKSVHICCSQDYNIIVIHTNWLMININIYYYKIE